MKKSQAKKVECILKYLEESPPTLLYLPTGVDDEFDEVFLLGGGQMIWLAEKDGPELPVLEAKDLSDDVELLFDLFKADEEEKLDFKKLCAFEDKLRKTLKEIPEDKLTKEEARDIKILFMDAKEELLEK